MCGAALRARLSWRMMPSQYEASTIDACISKVLFGRKKEGRRIEERVQEVRATLEALHVVGGDARQVEGVRGGEVRQGIALEIGPEDLHRVELGCVGRQQGDVPVLSMQVCGDDLGSVAGESVPDEDKGAAQVTTESAEEADQPRRGDVLVGAQREVQPRATAAWRSEEHTS